MWRHFMCFKSIVEVKFWKKQRELTKNLIFAEYKYLETEWEVKSNEDIFDDI